MLVNLKEEFNSPYNINHDELANGYATFKLEKEEEFELWKNQKIDNTFTPYEEI